MKTIKIYNLLLAAELNYTTVELKNFTPLTVDYLAN